MFNLAGSGCQLRVGRLPHSPVGSPGLVGVTTMCHGKAYFSLLLWLTAPPEELVLPAVPGQVIVLPAHLAGLRAILRTLCIVLL